MAGATVRTAAVAAAFGLAAGAALLPSAFCPSVVRPPAVYAGDETVTVPAGRGAPDDGDALLAAVAAARRIDREVDAALAAAGLEPAGPSDDAEFLRRVTLDVVGVPPTEEEVRAFLASKDPGKRQVVVETLLRNPLFGDHLAELWGRILFTDLRRYRAPEKEAVKNWLATGFQEGRGLDWMVRSLVTATGNNRENPALAFTMRFRDGGVPADIAGVTSRVFLGVQIQCAQCHDHPYESWKMSDFAGFAAFYNLVQPRPADPMDPRQGFVVEDPDPARLARGAARGGIGADIRGAAKGTPRFLDGRTSPDVEGRTRRGALADWMVARENPYFAKAMVNRAWSWYFGRGIVSPVDDFRTDNPPSHPALLDGLALGFAESGFDPRFLARAFTLSKAYGRTSRLPEAAKGWDEVALRRFDRLHGRGPVKPLTADMVFDSVLRVTGMDDTFRRANRAEIDRVKGQLLEQFVSEIDDDEGVDTEQWAGTIPQGLLLMNGPLTQAGTRGSQPAGRGDRIGLFARGNTLQTILDDTKDTAARVTRLYVTALGRSPTSREVEEAAAFAARGKGVQGWEDLFWALLNSSEFMSNH
jgi:hypothetical protein